MAEEFTTIIECSQVWFHHQQWFLNKAKSTLARGWAEWARLGHQGPADGEVGVLHHPPVLEAPDVLGEAGPAALAWFLYIYMCVLWWLSSGKYIWPTINGWEYYPWKSAFTNRLTNRDKWSFATKQSSLESLLLVLNFSMFEQNVWTAWHDRSLKVPVLCWSGLFDGKPYTWWSLPSLSSKKKCWQ